MTETNSPTSTGVSAWWRALSIFLLLVLFIAWAFSASMYEQFKAQIHHLEAKLIEVPQVREVSIGHAFIGDALERGYAGAVKAYLACMAPAEGGRQQA